MTNLLNSLVEFTKSDYAYVQPDSPEADAVFIDSIIHRDGKDWISNELHDDRRTSFVSILMQSNWNEHIADFLFFSGISLTLTLRRVRIALPKLKWYHGKVQFQQ